jgi:hypothetical protein
MIASVVGPPSPGRMPTTKPSPMPISMSPNAGQPKTWISPLSDALRYSTI